MLRRDSTVYLTATFPSPAEQAELLVFPSLSSAYLLLNCYCQHSARITESQKSQKSLPKVSKQYVGIPRGWSQVDQSNQHPNTWAVASACYVSVPGLPATQVSVPEPHDRSCSSLCGAQGLAFVPLLLFVGLLARGRMQLSSGMRDFPSSF